MNPKSVFEDIEPVRFWSGGDFRRYFVRSRLCAAAVGILERWLRRTRRLRPPLQKLFRSEVAEAVNDAKTDNEVAVIALGSTDDMGNPDKVDTEGIKDSWLEVSPSKIGRSPMRSPTRKQLEEPFISASKFYVLSTEEEDEEGETNDATSGNAIERDATGEEEDISVVEDLTENKPVEDDSQRVQKQRGRTWGVNRFQMYT
ncbi:hypothetical protein F2Q69_00022950 [Brassica cretica]|uniref:Uncharacterized protein n=1 Tax=Brassica cretica TaxID=69181 RepID=A0A8S9QAW2_BRACR|nr:hypothetical protein F2Q69_00022950 [Brassica cretica]